MRWAGVGAAAEAGKAKGVVEEAEAEAGGWERGGRAPAGGAEME